MQHEHDDAGFGIGTDYAVFQLAKALTTRRTHGNRDVRIRASARIRRWLRVLGHALRGTARYGSRTPFDDLPAWVTLEVATGGFATGRLLAGGELTAYERQLAASIPGVRAGRERLDLNRYFLSDAGIAELRQRLVRRDFAIEVPEEAALLTVAWLLDRGHTGRARALVQTIAPFLARLRFFPGPGAAAVTGGYDVIQLRVASVGDVADVLSNLDEPHAVATQRYAVERWLPWYDTAIALLLETCADDWPCQRYPDGWHERAAAHAKAYDLANRNGPRPGKRGRIAELRGLLDRCVRDAPSMSGREVARLRQLIGDFVQRYGHPAGAEHRQRRERQRQEFGVPPHHRFGKVVAARLLPYRRDGGLSDPDALAHAVTAEEAAFHAIAAGSAIPLPVLRRLRRCRSGSLGELVGHRLITSGDAMARMIPQMSAAARAAAFADSDLRELYAATYRAFRKRRSLLLLNLAHQVRLGELPWIDAIAPERHPDASSRTAARAVLHETAALAIGSFPFAIPPNKLLQEFRALAEAGGLDLVFLDELAADIFMGCFLPKFFRAAREAAGALRGSLYARYYGLDLDEIARLAPASSRTDYSPGRSQTDALASLCARRAGVRPGGWSPAVNGMIIEQQQIVTTHNLATLFFGAELRGRLDAPLPLLVSTCFAWICGRLQMKCGDHHAQLVTIKKAACAWRQLVFSASLLDDEARAVSLAEMQAHFYAQPAAFRRRFEPAVIGLRNVAAGRPLDDQGGRQFLGWSAAPHWLLVPAQ